MENQHKKQKEPTALPTSFENNNELATSIINGATKTDILQQCGHLRLPVLAKEPKPTLGALCRELGAQASRDCVAVLLADLSKSFHGELDKDDIMDIVEELHHGLFINMSLELIYLTCRKIKISNNYGKLTPNKVLSAMNDHLQELSNVISNENYNKHLSTKFTQERNAEKLEKRIAAQRKVVKISEMIKDVK